MGVREDLQTWIDGITDPLTGPVTQLGQVYDDLYEERKISINSLLGVVEDDVANTATINYNNSAIKVIINDIIDDKVTALETKLTAVKEM